ncbi:carbon-nitrogen hydrolase family protein [Actinoplanes derwentensis]|uniref:Predicted amidohydrolase n=1 Tax=Actinoplanes derwentensis TaxID=113562 RepID=A0A1H1ZT30_9ACTN|nr:carbon-nitrogen hydrolase family protein [Actinoplanes derwentensis]GID83561.1 hypothetical protein Ade03nite_24850 [Actinoplanes derwentensis]SDT36868.1 Predicted amidohydrolase [Actinoplanes derwentensis]
MTDTPVRFAAAQFFSGTDVTANAARCVDLLTEATAAGARLLVLTENANRVRDYVSRQQCWELSEDLDGEFVTTLRAACARLGIWCVAGVDVRAEAPDVHISSLLIDDRGELRHVHRKHVLWDYEYTLFVPGDEPLTVVHTELGRLGLLMCADGIVPDVPRLLALQGAEVLLNSLNSRGPDEMRVHVPLRAMENRVWHVSANTVGGPADAWPWMGGSQIVAPDGTVVAAADEETEQIIWADITPAVARDKTVPGLADVFAWRRPDLYADLLADLADVPVAAMYGPAPADMAPMPLDVATLQVSWFHNRDWTVTRALSQVKYAAGRGAKLGVLPELFCFRPGEVATDPAAAARFSAQVLARLGEAAAEHGIWLVAHLVESDGERFYSTAWLLDDTGAGALRYRRTHLSDDDRSWATPGDDLPVADTTIGRIGLMIGTEVWVPEVARVLAVRGAEIIAHPCSWDRPEAAHIAATERTEENRVHLVSAARLDNPAGVGSQILRADEFGPYQPIALMRYPSAVWSRHGFEEQLLVRLDRREAHSKMMGHHLDPVASRQPAIYGPLAGLSLK